MPLHLVTVEIVIDADDVKEAEHHVQGAMDNLLGSNILSAEVLDAEEVKDE